jgi:hypothetical protein
MSKFMAIAMVVVIAVILILAAMKPNIFQEERSALIQPARWKMTSSEVNATGRFPCETPLS